MVAYGPFNMFIRLKMKDEYSASIDKSKAKLDELKSSTDGTTTAIQKQENALQRSETRMLRANLTLAVFGTTMMAHGLYTLGIIDRHSKLGEVLMKTTAVIQVLSGVMAICNTIGVISDAISKRLIISKMGESGANLSNATASLAASGASATLTTVKNAEANAHFFVAAGAAAEGAAISWGLAAITIAAGIAVAVGAVVAAKSMGWFQTQPGEYKIVPETMLGVVHKGEVIGRPLSTTNKGGDIYATFNITESSNSFQTAREVAKQIEVLKRRGR